MDFFISYTKNDAQWAEWIAWELEANGYDCTIQKWDFKPGGDFIQQMRTAIENSKQTIAVLSPAYFKSEYAAAELNAALAEDPMGTKGKLIPVRVVNCQPEGMLRGRVYIDLVALEEQAARRTLLEGISATRLARIKPLGAVCFPAEPSFPIVDTNTLQTAEPVSIHAKDLLKIMFLASNAGTGYLDLQNEFKKLKEVIDLSKFRETISLSSRFEITIEDLFKSLNDYRPHILHFSGNMTKDGSILLNTQQGGVKAAGKAALIGLLRLFKTDIKLVILNACHSLDCAEALTEVIDCTIGVNNLIYDKDAIAFTEFFYRGISFGRSVKEAFDQAKATLILSGVDQKVIPELRCREGIDPSKIFFTQIV